MTAIVQEMRRGGVEGGGEMTYIVGARVCGARIRGAKVVGFEQLKFVFLPD